MMSSLANQRGQVCDETFRTCVHNSRPCHEMCLLLEFLACKVWHCQHVMTCHDMCPQRNRHHKTSWCMEQSPCWEISKCGIKRDTNMCDGEHTLWTLQSVARELKMDLGQCKLLLCDGDTYNVDRAIRAKGTENIAGAM